MRFSNSNEHNFPPNFYGNILHVSTRRGSGETMKIHPCEYPENRTSKTILGKFRTEQSGKIKLFLFISPLPRTQITSKIKLRHMVFYGRRTKWKSLLEGQETWPPKPPSNMPKDQLRWVIVSS